MTNWRDRAACLGLDPELFFPLDTRPDSLGTLRAKAVCARCPVRDECLADALDAGLDYGVYGGLTEDERRALKARAA